MKTIVDKVKLSCISPSTCRQGLATLVSSLTTLNYALTFSISAVLLPSLRNDETFEYDTSNDSWIASITPISMIIGAVCVGTIMDTIGRKKALFFLNLPYILGWLLIAIANSATMILLGRFITGLSAGCNRPLTLVYIGEISSPKFRAISLFIPSIISLIGCLLSHLIGGLLNWRFTCFMFMIPAIVTTIICLFIKESPIWLISQGKTKEGTEIFRWFRGTSEAAESELAEVLDSQGQKQLKYKDVANTIFNRSFVKPFILLTVLMINVQMSGVNVINFYAHDIYNQTFSGEVDAFAMMIAMDGLRVLVSIGLVFVGKIMPRKIMFISFSFAVTFSLIILIIYINLKIKSYLWIGILLITCYVAFSSAIVTMGWSFVPEIFPTKVRGLGSGITTAVSFGLVSIAAKLAPSIMNTYGVAALYAGFAVATVICAIVMLIFLPDTTGKTLQSIEDSYDKTKVVDQSKL